ncbi:MAG: Gfo/Idh/MocA family oxidoreductase [Gammaproteobacteria bacterium]|nr:Gfo/Idh/MocA family oxidoreductase [Gammaproteobacteria bacterium]
MTVRWGMIGCGDVTEVKSGPAFSLVEGSELVAVMRRNRALAEDYARRHDVPAFYDNADSLINDPQVDAVYIATPPSSHMELALKVAAAGKPCCVEKPMALNHSECMQMNQAFSKKKIPLFVAYYRRSLPRFLKIKEWLSANEIGQVRQLNWRLYKPPGIADKQKTTNWRTDPAIAGGGYFVDLASHGFDLFQYLLGDIAEVAGFSENQQKLYKAEDAVIACFRFRDGVLGTGSWNFAAHFTEENVEIIGERGKIEFAVFDEQPVRLCTENKNESLMIENPKHIQFFHIENMIAHLNHERVHPSLGTDAAKTNWVMDNILNQVTSDE